MFAEANRKRRKLEREKRVLERPPQGACQVHWKYACSKIFYLVEARRIPPPPPFLTDVPSLTIRELVKYSTTGLQQHNSRQRRRHPQRSAKPRSYPTLNVLSLAEVQTICSYYPFDDHRWVMVHNLGARLAREWSFPSLRRTNLSRITRWGSFLGSKRLDKFFRSSRPRPLHNRILINPQRTALSHLNRITNR